MYTGSFRGSYSAVLSRYVLTKLYYQPKKITINLLTLHLAMLVSHLQEDCALQLSKELVCGFDREDLEIDVSPGRGFRSMRLVVAIFSPKCQQNFPVTVITSEGESSSTGFQKRQPPPVALRDHALKRFIKQCHDNITQMVDLKQDISEMFRSNMNQVSQKIMKAIYKFYSLSCKGEEVS